MQVWGWRAKGIFNGSEKSLGRVIFEYLKYLHINREDMKGFHSWALEA